MSDLQTQILQTLLPGAVDEEAPQAPVSFSTGPSMSGLAIYHGQANVYHGQANVSCISTPSVSGTVSVGTASWTILSVNNYLFTPLSWNTTDVPGSFMMTV